MGKKRGKRLDTGITRLDDGRLRVRVTARDPQTGRQLERVSTLPRSTSLTEARHTRRLLRDDLQDNLTSTPEPIDSVEDYAIDWIARRAPTLKPTTLQWYEDIMAEWIMPFIGDVPVAQVTRRTAQHWVSATDRIPGYARSTRRGWWGLVKTLLKDLAADYGLPDPTERVKPPRRDDGAQSRESGALTFEELVEYTSAFRSTYPDRYPELLMLLSTGMRVGEMYGLKWESVDYVRGQLVLEASASKGVWTPTTKTGQTREVPLVDELARLLEEHRREMIRAQHPGLASGLVFPSDNGKSRWASSIRKPMKLVAESLGLSVAVGPQVLRRTVNTRLRQVADGTVAQAQLGHVTEEMGLHYARHDVAAKKEALERAFGTLLLGTTAGE